MIVRYQLLQRTKIFSLCFMYDFIMIARNLDEADFHWYSESLVSRSCHLVKLEQ